MRLALNDKLFWRRR